MKRKLLTLGVALIFTLSATLSAFAAANPAKIITRNWTNFRGNQSHNAVVSDKLPTSAENAALYWATKAGEGYGDGALRPRASLTRAQMAKLLTILDQDF